ncbi:hypothetical protein J4N45_11170 [Vibrio sp. SCSIO 43140]|uniref:hypothetical protein n=1 Tax=Vibrio sp. SCSIO 43140 TaxID=2819100 RepID=UPI00207610EC|nr:hypothetical protein [Vibrio sp. SCSIO 43140]USD59092.1 hypothetical protein J4N45_11170 [Vibrio sp. SCSIO 43140]
MVVEETIGKNGIVMVILAALLVLSAIWLVQEANNSLVLKYDYEAMEEMPPLPKVFIAHAVNAEGEVVLEHRTISLKE